MFGHVLGVQFVETVGVTFTRQTRIRLVVCQVMTEPLEHLTAARGAKAVLISRRRLEGSGAPTWPRKSWAGRSLNWLIDANSPDIAQRHVVVHRDINVENVLLHQVKALVMDIGTALAVTAAVAALRTVPIAGFLGLLASRPSRKSAALRWLAYAVACAAIKVGVYVRHT